MATTLKHAAQILGLDDGATLEDVRRARRMMALKYHPDRSKETQWATRKMASINAAADTMTAHLKKQSSATIKLKNPNYSKNFAHKTQAKKSAHSAADNLKTASSSSPKPKVVVPAQQDLHRGVQRPKPFTKGPAGPSESNLALARMASTCYRTVLDRIGNIDTGPSVDVQVLRFGNAI